MADASTPKIVAVEPLNGRSLRVDFEDGSIRPVYDTSIAVIPLFREKEDTSRQILLLVVVRYSELHHRISR